MSYTIAQERLPDVYPELEHLFRAHYAEMCARLEKLFGTKCSQYNPNLDGYFRADRDGKLLTFVARCDGIPVGYATVYVVRDMHNGDIIAQEDVLYVTPNHRNGLGRKLVKFGLEELRKRNVKKLNVVAMTDLRVVPLWKRMGFTEMATQMTYSF